MTMKSKNSNNFTTNSYAIGINNIHPDDEHETSDLAQRLNSLLSSTDGSFSVPRYLNLALAVSENPNEDVDQVQQSKMAELALQLQLESQRCHNQIEQIAMELNAMLPRCEADVTRLQVGLTGLQQDAASILPHPPASTVSASGSSSSTCRSSTTTGTANSSSADTTKKEGERRTDPLQTLTTLYALQTNLSLTRSILSAASSWDATVSKLPSLLSPNVSTSSTTGTGIAESGSVELEASEDPDSSNKKNLQQQQQHTSTTIANLKEAVQALSTLDHGARALRGLPGREDRDKIIADFRHSIQVLLKPRLLSALQQSHPLPPGAAPTTSTTTAARLGAIQQIASIYKLLGNTQTLEEEYVRARPATIHKLWFSFSPSTPLDFATWLPGWYTNILSFLSDERRRCTTIFGHDVAPHITAKLVAECFRPLLTSFQARLVAIFPHDPSVVLKRAHTASNNNPINFEAICSSYEATLQFLSLAYDHLTNVSPMQIRNLFSKVASPFAPYQRNFADLELQHSKLIIDDISKNIHKSVLTAVSTQEEGDNLGLLQDAVEKLSNLSLAVFPVVEACLARYELLNCGYKVSAFLSTLDSIFVSHTNDLIRAITSLCSGGGGGGGSTSSAEESNLNSLANNFDEQHVHCALEVLKLSGSYLRNLKNFTLRTRDRFRSLGTGMRASLEQQQQEDAETKAGGSVTSVATFDSMSNVEVGTLLAACAVGDELSITSKNDSKYTSSAITHLLRLSGEAKSSSSKQQELPTVFPNVVISLVELEHAAQLHVFGVLYSVPQVSLQSVASLTTWRSGTAMSHDATAAAVLGNEGYSILPQQYITRVGEHVLALVQALEPFASSRDALSLANEVMSGVNEVAMQPWKDFCAACGNTSVAGKKDIILNLMSGTGLSPLLIRNGGNEDDMKEREDDADDEESIFCNKWLDVVCCAVTGRFLERILRVAKLSPHGAKKLTVDLGYLINVFSALGVIGHPHPLLGYFVSLVEMDSEELTHRIQRRPEPVEDPTITEILRTLRAMEQRVAAIRGVGID